jgi:hypothetical protein
MEWMVMNKTENLTLDRSKYWQVSRLLAEVCIEEQNEKVGEAYNLLLSARIIDEPKQPRVIKTLEDLKGVKRVLIHPPSDIRALKTELSLGSFKTFAMMDLCAVDLALRNNWTVEVVEND